MKTSGTFIACLLLAGGLTLPVLAAEPVAADHPYTTIASRNAFALVPIPVAPPVDLTPPADPPPKITPNGIMTLFGRLQVLFKVAAKPLPGQPAKDESYVMIEGERQDEIEVVKIDGKAGMVTFNNHGQVQQLALVAGTASSPAAAAGAGAVGQPGMSSRFPMPTTPGAVSPGIGGNNFSRFSRHGRGGDSGGGSPSAAVPAVPAGANTAEVLSPEAQIIMMEKQRADFLDRGNPAAAIIPPTPITHLITGENGGNPNVPPGPPSP